MDKIYETTLEESISVLNSLNAASPSSEHLPYNHAKNHDFGKDFAGDKISNCDFSQCRFVETNFTGANGQNSRFIKCTFVDCHLNSCNMQFCDFSGSVIISKEFSDKIQATNFSFSDMSHVHIDAQTFEGVSIYQTLFLNSELSNTVVKRSTIEASKFVGARISDCDFSEGNIRYCEFDNSIIERTCFPLLDIPFNFGIIDMLKQRGCTITAKARNGQIYSAEEILPLLSTLMPYYNESEQYFAYCNLLLVANDQKSLYLAVEASLRSMLKSADYYGMKNLCKLAVLSKLFDKLELRSFYEQVFYKIRPKSENYNELKRFISCRNEIRELLIENPEQRPMATFVLSTSIEQDNYQELSKLMATIEQDIVSIDNDAIVSFQADHHSPFDLLCAFLSSPTNILLTCQLVYYAIATIKNSSDLLGQRKNRKPKTHDFPEGIIIDYRKNTRSVSFGERKLVLTNEKERCYGTIKNLTYTITGVDPEITDGQAFMSNH